MSGQTVLELALKRDRLIVIIGLVLVSVLSWAYLLAGAGMGMDAFVMTSMTIKMPNMDMNVHWNLSYSFIMFTMWWVMMIAMMLPSAAPMILLFAKFNRTQREQGKPYIPTSIFAGGYLISWGLFSLLATALQWALEAVGLISEMMISTNHIFAGLLLIAAGAYQLTPLKHTCLKHCRNPLQFLTAHWKPGKSGALKMGLYHGYFCLVCCWFLMCLLFVGGVMNLWWIAGLALFVLLEKTVPAGHWLGYATGFALLIWGGVRLYGSIA